jgi:four helix bundle protein
MPSIADELAARARSFSIRVLKFARALPRESITETVVRQLVKSATSESASYNAARRGRSRREFSAKLAIVVEEADETEH